MVSFSKENFPKPCSYRLPFQILALDKLVLDHLLFDKHYCLIWSCTYAFLLLKSINANHLIYRDRLLYQYIHSSEDQYIYYLVNYIENSTKMVFFLQVNVVKSSSLQLFSLEFRHYLSMLFIA